MEYYLWIWMNLSLSNSLVSENRVDLLECSIPCGLWILILEGIKELPAKHMENIMQAGIIREILAIHASYFPHKKIVRAIDVSK